MWELASARSMQYRICGELCRQLKVIKFVVGKLCPDKFFNPCILIFAIILSYLLNILCWWIVRSILYRNVHWNVLLYAMTTTLLSCIFLVVMKVVWQFPHASYFVYTSIVSFHEVILYFCCSDASCLAISTCILFHLHKQSLIPRNYLKKWTINNFPSRYMWLWA